MADSKTLNDLFLETLKDIYYAEKQILKALPKMARAAQDPKVKAGFEEHRDQTEGHVERLEQIFEMMGKPVRGKTCDAILGIIEEGKEIMEEFKDSKALDPGLIAAAQAVEHYEIARYGTLRAWAQQMGMSDCVKLLEETLKEEVETDKKLSQLAIAGENRKAA
jgi:ferritin-like metal-binding protein YciE